MSMRWFSQAYLQTPGEQPYWISWHSRPWPAILCVWSITWIRCCCTAGCLPPCGAQSCKQFQVSPTQTLFCGRRQQCIWSPHHRSINWKGELKMSHSRRDFLRSSLVIGAAAAVSRFGFLDVLAQSTDYKALVCIFLYGGNDSNNMVVPNGTDGYQAYARARGPLALPQASLLAIQPSSTGARFGLHPSLNELHPLWTQKKLAVLCNVGTLVEPLTKADYEAGSKRAPDQLFSHQDQQNQWQTSICDRPIDTGWGGRIADRVLALNGSVAFPMIISGGGDELFVSAADTDALGVDPNSGFGAEGFDDSPESTARYNGLRQTLLVDTDHTLVRAASTITKRALDSQEVLNRALAAPVTTAFPVTDLGLQLAQVAHIIAGRSITGLTRQIFFCAQGGYDTHSDELNSHVQLYTELSQALSAFYAATVELGVAPQVTTFTLSDRSEER